MPSMMGLVTIPFSVLFQSPCLGASLAGEVRERTTTAMMLYRGTLPDDHQRHQPCVPINIRGQRNAQQGALLR